MFSIFKKKEVKKENLEIYYKDLSNWINEEDMIKYFISYNNQPLIDELSNLYIKYEKIIKNVPNYKDNRKYQYLNIITKLYLNSNYISQQNFKKMIEDKINIVKSEIDFLEIEDTKKIIEEKTIELNNLKSEKKQLEEIEIPKLLSQDKFLKKEFFMPDLETINAFKQKKFNFMFFRDRKNELQNFLDDSDKLSGEIYFYKNIVQFIKDKIEDYEKNVKHITAKLLRRQKLDRNRNRQPKDQRRKCGYWEIKRRKQFGY